MNRTAWDELMDESTSEGSLSELFKKKHQEDGACCNANPRSVTPSNLSYILPGCVPPHNTPDSPKSEDDWDSVYKKVSKPYDGPDPMIEKVRQMWEHLEELKGQVSEFQYDLERYEHIQDLAFEDQNLHDLKSLCTGITLSHKMKPCLAEMYYELKVILELPNFPEIEMYADLINKCCAFGSIMETWMDSILQPWFDGTAEIITGPITNTNLWSPCMVWEMDKINIVLERITGMINCTISEVTGVEFEIIQSEISQEVEPLAKTFLWLTLKDQKRYAKTSKEYNLDEKIHSMSYIDQHPTSLEYCTNVVRCVITEEIEAYLSCHFADGMAPEINPEAIRSRASCRRSRAAKYAAALNQVWTFLEESNVKIDTQKIRSNYALPTEVSVLRNEDSESEETESVSPAETSASSAQLSVSPGESSAFSLKNVEDTHVEPAKEDSLPTPPKEHGIIYKFFVSVGRAISNTFSHKNSAGV